MPTCNEALTARICQLVRASVLPVTAAATEGLDKETFQQWMLRGQRRERGNWRFQRFRQAVIKAEADCEVLLIGKVRQALMNPDAVGDVQAAEWLLERRFPDRWVRRSVSVERDEPPSTSATQWSDLDAETNVTPIRRRR